MMRRFARFASDRSGLAALEFALIAPLLATLLVVGADTWLNVSQNQDMRTALQSGARYYQTGGADDPTAQLVAQQAWPGKPADGAVSVARSCTCGSSPVDCATLCTGSNPPSVFLTLTASGTFTGLLQSHAMSQNDTVRVR
ncbi:TadE/TadG family type IV pilus assembly protein [Phenylobacterium sp.]|jgi:Flp pilus assembly protein TadG|uniref:TadE/TadG family type IV pilus assembly protein n=1 Tax=Phenylobacterium sp. TaxID=1871053 RepID=UPI002E2FAAA5|nr:TadE/TadG family type IV pilus assembly protein [Phenylobacterium sp.]HEX3363737.1 TadE/TadG family type IV pilus assembly protein [Phenylobacterium sp.]